MHPLVRLGPFRPTQTPAFATGVVLVVMIAAVVRLVGVLVVLGPMTLVMTFLQMTLPAVLIATLVLLRTAAAVLMSWSPALMT